MDFGLGGEILELGCAPGGFDGEVPGFGEDCFFCCGLDAGKEGHRARTAIGAQDALEGNKAGSGEIVGGEAISLFRAPAVKEGGL